MLVLTRPNATKRTPDISATVERHGGSGSARRRIRLSPTASHRNTNRLTGNSANVGDALETGPGAVVRRQVGRHLSPPRARRWDGNARRR
jgi:hypothetical protein